MIKITNMSKKYKTPHGNKWVFKNVNLTIPDGVSVGLIGGNGEGKSTFLRLIGNMDKPDSGSIIRTGSVSWPIGLSGGFQSGMTGRQNVKFVARVHGFEDVKKIISYVEEFSELGASFDEPITTYSSGMRSRLAFGMSLAFDFDVYLSDEATAVGDARFKKKAAKAFRDRVGKASLIMVSHSEGILKELCQAGIWLRSGAAIWYDDIHDALSDYNNGSVVARVESKGSHNSPKKGYKGHCHLKKDSSGRYKLMGWALKDGSTEPQCLRIEVNNECVADVMADKYRKDLEKKFGVDCAFEWVFPEELSTTKLEKVRVAFKDVDKDLINSPFVLKGVHL